MDVDTTNVENVSTAHPVTTRPSTSRGLGVYESTVHSQHPASHNQMQQNSERAMDIVSDECDRLEDRVRMPRRVASRARFRSAGQGARPDRLCNRDRNELLCQALAKLIVRKMLPLSFVSSDAFKDFLAVVEPNFKVPCVKTIKNRLNLMREQLTNKIKAELSAATGVACTADCWSSISQDSYLTITAHFLDPNWTPKSFTLTTEEVCERHTAANLTARLHNAISHWDLDGKISTVVTDNAPNSKNSVRALDNLFVNKGVTCAAHSL